MDVGAAKMTLPTSLHVDAFAENLKMAMATFEDGHQKWLKIKRCPLPCDVAYLRCCAAGMGKVGKAGIGTAVTAALAHNHLLRLCSCARCLLLLWQSPLWLTGYFERNRGPDRK
jgi:hypothetical protein